MDVDIHISTDDTWWEEAETAQTTYEGGPRPQFLTEAAMLYSRWEVTGSKWHVKQGSFHMVWAIRLPLLGTTIGTHGTIYSEGEAER